MQQPHFTIKIQRRDAQWVASIGTKESVGDTVLEAIQGFDTNGTLQYRCFQVDTQNAARLLVPCSVVNC